MTIGHETFFYKNNMIAFLKIVDRETATLKTDSMNTRLCTIVCIDYRKAAFVMKSGEARNDTITPGPHLEIRVRLCPVVFGHK